MHSKFESVFQVRPDDIDMFQHVHNSTYFDYVLAARYDQMARCYGVLLRRATSDLDERQLLHVFRASHEAVNAYSWLWTACSLIALYFNEIALAATIFGSLLFITIGR